jgi:hypothetical protein
VVSPGGSGRLELTSSGDIDDKTSNDALQFTLVGNPSSGDFIDLANGLKITSFAGYRLNPAHALFASGVGYRNTNPNVGGDGFTLKVTDASAQFSTSNVSVRITTNVTGEARIVSDPLLTMDRGATKTHSLAVVGPTTSDVEFTISALPGFSDPGSAVAVPGGKVTSSDGLLFADITITAPASGNYLAFLLTCKIGTVSPRITKQPFIIRLLPIVNVGAAN